MESIGIDIIFKIIRVKKVKNLANVDERKECPGRAVEKSNYERASGKGCGEGNGNPLQYCCLEDPRDSGAWWAAVCGVTQSWTRPKQLSSSSSSFIIRLFSLKMSFHCFYDYIVSHEKSFIFLLST